MADIDYTAKWTMKALLAYYFSLPAGHPHGFQVTRNSVEVISSVHKKKNKNNVNIDKKKKNV